MHPGRDDTIPLDDVWQRVHPLPVLGTGEDKRDRGVVMAIGSSITVPGALLLSGEAALRAGAGKVQLALPKDLAVSAGIAFPEAAVMGLGVDDEGEIDDDLAKIDERLGRSDVLLVGPGMVEQPHTAVLVASALARLGDDAAALIDAGALTSLRACADAVRARGTRIVLTPHPGELARLIDVEQDKVECDPMRMARAASERFGCTIVLKAEVTHIVTPDAPVLVHETQAPGLGTAGSGDVLSGIIAGLLARGLAPWEAAGWGVRLHGKAGAKAGPGPFLARELLPLIPKAIAAAQSG